VAGATVTARVPAAPPVAVLLGGPSAEHDVSLVSGRAIAAALAARGHAVDAWLITLDGDWWRLSAAAVGEARPPRAYDAPADLAAEGPYAAAVTLERLAAASPPPVVWIALHGPFGEDGTIQALCEAAGLVYTGSGVAASSLAMDKQRFKQLARGLELPVVPWRWLDAAHYETDAAGELARVAAFAAALPDPRLMVKPARLGSSIGMTIVRQPAEPAEMAAALAAAFRHDDLVLVEAYLAGARELEVGLLGNSLADLQVYGPGEIFPGHEFYDYHAKYDPGVSRTTTHPDLAERLRTTIREQAAAAYLGVGASGFGRVDFLVHGGRVYLSELNTIPGFTPISLFPMLVADGGLEFGALAARIVELAVARAARRPLRRLTRAELP
jgi:D-alanine-D-alanine ligase